MQGPEETSCGINRWRVPLCLLVYITTLATGAWLLLQTHRLWKLILSTHKHTIYIDMDERILPFFSSYSWILVPNISRIHVCGTRATETRNSMPCQWSFITCVRGRSKRTAPISLFRWNELVCVFLWFEEVLRILRKSKDFGVLLIWIFIVLFLWNNLYWFFFLFRFFYRCFFLLGSLDNRHFELFILFPLMNCYGKCLIFMQSGNPRWWILKRVRISFSKVNVLFEHTGAQPPCPPPSLPFSSSSSPLYIAEFSSLFHFYPSSSYITFSILLSSFFIALALSLNFFVPPDTAARSCPSC